jgi:hypothetical protein
MRFSEIDRRVKHQPGLYEIWTRSGRRLKIGIAADLLDRLRKHRASRDSGLRCSLGSLASVTDPKQITSKSSILAKHLFFDAKITTRYDLRCEADRRQFLESECRLTVEYFPTRSAARTEELRREAATPFRYQGRVILRGVARRGR